MKPLLDDKGLPITEMDQLPLEQQKSTTLELQLRRAIYNTCLTIDPKFPALVERNSYFSNHHTWEGDAWCLILIFSLARLLEYVKAQPCLGTAIRPNQDSIAHQDFFLRKKDADLITPFLTEVIQDTDLQDALCYMDSQGMAIQYVNAELTKQKDQNSHQNPR